MNCEEYSDLVAAHADGCLNPDERERADRHAADCPRCAAMRRAQIEVAGALRARRSVRPAPESLRAAIEGRTINAAADRKSTTRTRVLMAGAIAAAVLLSVLPPFLAKDGGVIPLLAADIARAESTPPEIRTTSPVALRSYYKEAGLSFEGTVEDLEPFGFDLVGGTKSNLGGIPSTLTVYDHGGEQLSCRRFRGDNFTWPEGGRRVGQSEVFAHDGVYVALTRLPGNVICAMTSRIPPERFLTALQSDH